MAAGRSTPNMAVGSAHLSSHSPDGGKNAGAVQPERGHSQAAVEVLVRATIFWKLSLVGPLAG